MSTFFDSASLALIPSGVKDGKVYSIKPTPEYGEELVTNGSFATDSDWTKESGWTISGGNATFDGRATTGALLQSLGLTTGATYRVSFDVVNYNNGSVKAYLSNGSPTGASPLITSSGSYVFDIVATGPAILFRNVTNFDGSIDNVSVQEIVSSGDFTFSRGTDTATRVNSSGLIEKERSNQLLQSNTFDTTWALGGGTLTSGQTGYDGSSDAWLFTYTSGAAIVNQPNTFSGVQTYSVYAKGSAANGIRLYAFGSVNANAYFDLNIGEVEDNSGIIDAKIEDKGNGWYRCSITFDQTNTNIYMYLTGNNNSSAGSGSVLIQDAQLEQGLVATDYIETTTAAVYEGITDNLPRLDYSGGASCPSLLLEPSRTNGFAQSEYFKALMTNDADITIDDNAATSPEGVQNAARLNFNAASKSMYRAINFAGEHTYSFYVKAEGSNIGKTFNFRLRDTSSVAVNHSVPLTGEWVRHDFQFSDSNLMEFTNREGTTIADGSILLWGIQIEAGSYPTSYIPTYGTSASRVGENNVITSASALIGQTEGTMYYEFNSGKNDGADYVVSLSDGSANNRIIIYRSSANQLIAQIRTSAVSVAQINTSTLTEDITYKVALGYANNDVVFYVNGTQIGSDTSATIPATDRIATDNSVGSATFGRPLNQFLLFKTRLTNAELASITTL